MSPDLTLCLRSWAEELIARASRVRQLIGDKHWLSDGHQKEFLLREFLSRHLPSNLHISRGFIRPPDVENPLSGEIDILLCDFDVHPPWFNEGGVVIAPPSSVVSQVHVKTSLGSEEIADVLLSTSAAYRSMSNYIQISQIWAGALFFDSTPCTEKTQLRKQIQSWIQHFVFDSRTQKLTHVVFPNCLATIGGCVIFFDKTTSAEGEIQVRAFDCGSLAPAILFADMFEHLRTRNKSGQRRGELSSLLEKITLKVLFKTSFELKPKMRTKRKP